MQAQGPSKGSHSYCQGERNLLTRNNQLLENKTTFFIMTGD